MTAGPPPPRPSTARLNAPPLASRQGLPRPRVVTVSCWLWWLAAVVVVATVVLTMGRLDAVRAELGQAVRDSDSSATSDRVEQVVDLSVLVIVGGGALFGAVGALLARRLRAGRRWARLALTIVAVLVVAYGVLVFGATGWLVLAYLALVVVATVFMYLPGGARWLT
jgi:uncharacterized membrane protein YhaH (DUF805 family)